MRSDLIEKALDTLRHGGTLLYPTDTIWGIGCDACCSLAVERIYDIKERNHSKAMLVLVNEEMLSPALPSTARNLLLHSDRPTTVILPQEFLLTNLAENLPANDGAVGVRIPKFDFCQALLERLGHPIVSTSANFSGRPSPTCYDDIEHALMERVDYSLPNDVSFSHPPQPSSRIVKLENDGKVVVIRN